MTLLSFTFDLDVKETVQRVEEALKESRRALDALYAEGKDKTVVQQYLAGRIAGRLGRPEEVTRA
jgi:hypothetical protein